MAMLRAGRAMCKGAFAARKRLESALSLAGLLVCLRLWCNAQSNFKPQPHEPTPQSSALGEAWRYSVTVDGYLSKAGDGYAQPTFTADHKWLHLEARYNYENFRIGSIWAGYNFAWGSTWRLQITPMIGGVFGRALGIAPGCEAELNWKRLNLFHQQRVCLRLKKRVGQFLLRLESGYLPAIKVVPFWICRAT
jgi:hypothetical protein